MEYLSGYEEVKVIDHVLFQFTYHSDKKEMRMKAEQNDW